VQPVIDKKRGAQYYVDFSLVSHTLKIVLKILTWRLESTAESYRGKAQFGSRKGHGTTDAIAALSVLYESNLEYNNKVYVCYIDYEKSFSRIDWTKLMVISQNIGDWCFRIMRYTNRHFTYLLTYLLGVDWRNRKLIWNLHNKQ